MTDPIPSAATGLWRRREISFPDGRRDTTTRVLWLQTQHLFADLRVPADRPVVTEARGFADYPAEDLPHLAAMQGFAGRFEVDGKICRWRRELDFQPPGGPPDEAQFRIDGDILVETGIHAAYEEIWQRETPPGADLAAFRLLLDDAAVPGMLVLAGDHFIAVEERRSPLPAASSLADLLAADAGSVPIADRLGLLIAYGRIGRNGGAPWRVDLSTWPWLEGRSLAEGGLRFDAAAELLHLIGREGRRSWRLVETNCPPSRLAGWFAG
jgi:hypothetical protein